MDPCIYLWKITIMIWEYRVYHPIFFLVVSSNTTSTTMLATSRTVIVIKDIFFILSFPKSYDRIKSQGVEAPVERSQASVRECFVQPFQERPDTPDNRQHEGRFLKVALFFSVSPE